MPERWGPIIDELARIRASDDRDPERGWRRLEGGAQARPEWLVTRHLLAHHLPPPMVDAARLASMHGERATSVRPFTLLIGGIIAFVVGCGAPTLAPTAVNPATGAVASADLPPSRLIAR
jgi:hypothetical protein